MLSRSRADLSASNADQWPPVSSGGKQRRSAVAAPDPRSTTPDADNVQLARNFELPRQQQNRARKPSSSSGSLAHIIDCSLNPRAIVAFARCDTNANRHIRNLVIGARISAV